MYDFTLSMKDAGLVAASAAATVGGAAKIANVGNGRVDGEMVIDVTAIEIASNDELYAVAIRGAPTFKRIVSACLCELTNPFVVQQARNQQ